METLRINARSPEAIHEAAKFLQTGDLVIFPTDTVYGLGVDAFNPRAIMTLYKTKRRPPEKGIPILLADPSGIHRIVAHVSDLAQKLIDRYWPGPLTLIMAKRIDIPMALTPNDGIAVRIPDNDIARALIRAAGGAIAASSANLTGQPPSVNADEAMKVFSGHVGVILDAGPANIGLASTVVDCRGKIPVIIRTGPIREVDIRDTVMKLK